MILWPHQTAAIDAALAAIAARRAAGLVALPTERWHRGRATGKQIAHLMSFGLGGVDDKVPCGLTEGEASYLIDRALELEAKYPTPATPNQRYFLIRAGQWREGLSKREAQRLTGKVKAEQAQSSRQQKRSACYLTSSRTW